MKKIVPYFFTFFCIGLLYIGIHSLNSLSSNPGIDFLPSWITLFPVGISALGLIVCAVFCIFVGRGWRIRPLFLLSFPLVSTFLSAFHWFLEARNIPSVTDENSLEYSEFLSSIVNHSAATLETPVLGLFWSGLAFVGTALVAASVRMDMPKSKRKNPLRWFGVLFAIAGAASAIIVIFVKLPIPEHHSIDLIGLELGSSPSSFLILLRDQPISLQVALLGLVLLPLFLLPIGVRHGPSDVEAVGEDKQFLAKTLAASSIAGAMVALSFASFLWKPWRFLLWNQQYEPPLILHPFTQLPSMVAVFLIIGGVSFAFLTIAPEFRRWRQMIPTVAGTMVVLLSVFILRGFVDSTVSRPTESDEVSGILCSDLVGSFTSGRVASQPVEKNEAFCCTRDALTRYQQLHLPRISGNLEFAQNHTIVEINRHAILVDDKRTVDLIDGKIHFSNKAQGRESFFIQPLSEALNDSLEFQRQIAKRKLSETSGRELNLLIDKNTSSQLVNEVLLTASRADFARLAFAVWNPELQHRCPYRTVVIPGAELVHRSPGKLRASSDRAKEYAATGALTQLAIPRFKGSDGRAKQLSPTDMQPEEDNDQQADSQVPSGCHSALYINSPPIESQLTGTYWTEECFAVRLGCVDQCPSSETGQAKLWTLEYGDDRYELTSPAGEKITADTAGELAKRLKKHSEFDTSEVRTLKLVQTKEIPFARELSLRAVLVSPNSDLFSAAVDSKILKYLQPQKFPVMPDMPNVRHNGTTPAM